MKPINNPRQLAVMCAHEVERKSLLIPEAMATLPFKLSPDDRNLAYEVSYGTFRYLPGLNTVLGRLCKPGKLPPKIRWLLLTSLYQLRFMRVPAYAILDEANKLALAMKFKGLKGLVNGVLRNAERKEQELTADISLEDWLLPPWLNERLRSQYGSETLTNWLASWDARPTLSYWSADDNPLEGDEASDLLPHAWRRDKPVPQEAYEAHKIYVQNESSQAIAELACRLKADAVLDLCAAPGGKICYLASFGEASRLVANDQPGERLGRLRENRERLGLSFEINCGDGRELTMEPFDLVLLDAPCSGIGIIGRHPEIKSLKKEPADETLRQLQAELLQAAWALVKPQGHLLYTVCSLDKQELPEMPGDAQAGIDPQLAEGLPLTLHDGSFHLAPNTRFDGFAGMLLQKQPSTN